MWRFGSYRLKRIIFACVAISFLVVIYNLAKVNDTSHPGTGKNVRNKPIIHQPNDNGIPNLNQEDDSDDPVVDIKMFSNKNDEDKKSHGHRSINDKNRDHKRGQHALPIPHVGLNDNKIKEKHHDQSQQRIDDEEDRLGRLEDDDNGRDNDRSKEHDDEDDPMHGRDNRFHQHVDKDDLEDDMQHPEQRFKQFPIKSKKKKHRSGQQQFHNVQDDHDDAFLAEKRHSMKRDDEDEIDAQMDPFEKNANRDELPKQSRHRRNANRKSQHQFRPADKDSNDDDDPFSDKQHQDIQHNNANQKLFDPLNPLQIGAGINNDPDDSMQKQEINDPAKPAIRNENEHRPLVEGDQNQDKHNQINNPKSNQDGIDEIDDPILKAHLQDIKKNDISQVSNNEHDPMDWHRSNEKQSQNKLDHKDTHANNERIQQKMKSSAIRNRKSSNKRLHRKKKFLDSVHHHHHAMKKVQDSDTDDINMNRVKLQRLKHKSDIINGKVKSNRYKIRKKRSQTSHHRTQKESPSEVDHNGILKDMNVDQQQQVKNLKHVKRRQKHIDDDHHSLHKVDNDEDDNLASRNHNNHIEHDVDDQGRENINNAVKKFNFKSFSQDEDEINQLREQQNQIEQHLMNAKNAVGDNGINLPSQRKTKSVSSPPVQRPQQTKIILLWTRYYKSSWKMDMDITINLPLGRKYFKEYCKVKNCYLTTDKMMYKKSHAIVFNDRDLPDHIAQMPYFNDRQPWQRWVYYNIESPHFARGYKPFFINAGMFNWSMTYHHNADIDINYGFIVPREISGTTLPDYHGSKQQLLTWAVSHCLYERMHYVRALAKYISIKVYGICGNNTCNGTNSQCWEKVFSRSMFYLAFENSICTEYITEKFWNPLRYGVIPVVLGGADYRKVAPPKSYIDARDFPSVKDLAAYLYKVSRNKQLYNSYMKWKLKWQVVIPRHWCNLCTALHDSSRPAKVYTTLNSDWDGLNRQCKPYPNPYEYLP